MQDDFDSRLVFDMLSGELTRGGRALALRPTELALLTAMTKRPTGLSREELCTALFGHLPEERRRASLKVVVCRLRRKVGPGVLKTVASGYALQLAFVESLSAAERDAARWRENAGLLDDSDRHAARARAAKLRNRRVRSKRLHFAPHDVALRLAALESGILEILARDALLRGEPLTSLEYAREGSRIDPSDERACDATAAAYRALHRDDLAADHLASHRNLVGGERSIADVA